MTAAARLGGTGGLPLLFPRLVAADALLVEGLARRELSGRLLRGMAAAATPADALALPGMVTGDTRHSPLSGMGLMIELHDAGPRREIDHGRRPLDRGERAARRQDQDRPRECMDCSCFHPSPLSRNIFMDFV